EGQRTVFTVHAKSNLGFKDNKGVLQDVDVIIYGATEKDPSRTIRGDSCTYDRDTNDFQFIGNVEVRLDEKTVVHTEQINYSQTKAVVVAPGPANVQQGATMARANSLEYAIDTGLL